MDKPPGNLAARTERALLGALLVDRKLATELDLERGDFADHTNSDVYEAIVGTAVDPSIGPAFWRQAIRLAAGPEVTDRHLDSLQRTCPDPKHGRAYATLIMEGRLSKSLATHGQHILHDGLTLRHDIGRLSSPGRQLPTWTEDIGSRLFELGSALYVHGSRFDPGKWISIPEPGANLSDDREECILAGLIQKHPQSAEIFDALPAIAFTDAVRGDVYAAIRQLHRKDQPIDEITVEWQFARTHEASDGFARKTAPDRGRQGYLARLARQPTDADLLSTAEKMREHLACCAAIITPPSLQPEGPATSARIVDLAPRMRWPNPPSLNVTPLIQPPHRPPEPGGPPQPNLPLHGASMTSPSAADAEEPGALPFAIKHAEMSDAYDEGTAIPLSRSIYWIASYRDAWWVLHEHGWLRITEQAVIDDINRAAARLGMGGAIPKDKEQSC